MKSWTWKISLETLKKSWRTVIIAIAVVIYLIYQTLLVLREGFGAPLSVGPESFLRMVPYLAFFFFIEVIGKFFDGQKPTIAKILRLAGLYLAIGMAIAVIDWMGFSFLDAKVYNAACLSACAPVLLMIGVAVFRRRWEETALAPISGAEFLNWCKDGRKDFQQANLFGVVVSGADLHEVDFSRADLRSADLRGSDLRGANLTNVRLDGANLQGAQVSIEQLAQAASLVGTILPDGTEHT